MKTISYAAAGLLVLSVLAGCSRSEPEEAPPTENAVSEEAPPAPEETRAPEPEPAPEPAPVATANVVAPPPAAAIAPDEQMLDDADATGMTARATRDEPVADAPPANETEDK